MLQSMELQIFTHDLVTEQQQSLFNPHFSPSQPFSWMLNLYIFVYSASIHQDTYFSQTDVKVFLHHFFGKKKYPLSKGLIL